MLQYPFCKIFSTKQGLNPEPCGPGAHPAVKQGPPIKPQQRPSLPLSPLSLSLTHTHTLTPLALLCTLPFLSLNPTPRPREASLPSLPLLPAQPSPLSLPIAPVHQYMGTSCSSSLPHPVLPPPPLLPCSHPASRSRARRHELVVRHSRLVRALSPTASARCPPAHLISSHRRDLYHHQEPASQPPLPPPQHSASLL